MTTKKEMQLAALAVMSLLWMDVTIAQVSWDFGAFTSDWNDPLNWDTDMVPVSGDDVEISGMYYVEVVADDGMRGTRQVFVR